MKKLGLRVTSFWRKSRKYNSYKGTVGKIAKNKLQRRFNTRIPHQKITTDTTEFKYYEKGIQKKAYLNPFLELFNNEIVSFALSKQPNLSAYFNCPSSSPWGNVWLPLSPKFSLWPRLAYQMTNYVDTLKRHRVFQWMSRNWEARQSPLFHLKLELI